MICRNLFSAIGETRVGYIGGRGIAVEAEPTSMSEVVFGFFCETGLAMPSASRWAKSDGAFDWPAHDG